MVPNSGNVLNFTQGTLPGVFDIFDLFELIITLKSISYLPKDKGNGGSEKYAVTHLKLDS